MFVLSQDRDYLVNLNNGNIEIVGKNKIIFIDKSQFVCLGEYETKDIANEVLSYIVSAIERDKKVYVMPQGV